MLQVKQIKKVWEFTVTFFIGQSATQAVQLVCGFLLINLMSKGEYADFTLAMAILGSAAVLSDLGITQTLTGLIGNQITDSGKVGRYLAACRFYRNRLILLVCLVLVFVFTGFGRKYSWSFETGFFLWLSVVLSIYFQSHVAMRKPLLLLERRLKDSYFCELLASSVRLLLIPLFSLLGWLVAPLVVFLGCLREALAATFYRKKTADKSKNPDRGADLKEEKKEILGQSMPRVPSLLFGSLSGQFMVFAMGILGTREGLAEIGALGRLGMLFLIFQSAGGNLIAPYFSRLHSSLVKIKSVQVIAIIVLFCVSVSSVARFFPELFLIILGDGYGHLKYEVFLVVCASLVRISSMLIFSICLARKYVYYWYSIVDIAPQISVMVAFILFVDLSSLLNLLYFGLSMATAKFASKAFILCVGIKTETRTIT